MKKIIKITILALVVAVTLSLASCSFIERVFLGGDPYEFNNITLTQVGVNEFRVEFDSNCGREDVEIYLTEGFRRSESVSPKKVEKTADGKKAHISFTETLNLGEDYYLWIVSGDKEAKTSISIPSMFPTIVMNEDGSATFDFKYTYDTAWGSFCDPTGKSVYKSTKPVFDSSAVLIQDGIEITTETCVVPAEMVDPACYYFSVSAAKDGTVKSISCPVVLFDDLKSQVQGISSTVTSDLKLQVAVQIPTSSVYAPMVADSLQLIIKTSIVDEIYVVDSVYEDGVATMEFDMTQLLFDGLWYDLVFAWNGAAVMDVPQYVNGHSVEIASSVKKDGIIYRTVGWKAEDAPQNSEILKVYFEEDTTRYADEICKSYLVSFSATSEPALVVTAKFKDGIGGTPVLAITAGNKTKITSVSGVLNEDGSYTFSLPVTEALTVADNWYDLRFFIGETAYEMLKDSCITYENYAAKYVSGDRVYQFHEWNGMLKLSFI